ncbi:MAG: DUF58 domain-containing protein [bacterium]|nr:DUF58 domain-containing protein [bacterium]
MTGRGRWLMFCALAGLIAGVARGQSSLVMLSLAVFIWIAFEWIWFQIRVQFQLPGIQCVRYVNDRNTENDILWCGRLIRIRVEIRARQTIYPLIAFRDVVPELMELVYGSQRGGELAARVPQAAQADSASLLGRGLESLKKATMQIFAWCLGNQPQRRMLPNEFLLERPGKEFDFQYCLRARAAGILTMPGLRVMLNDRFGFFRMYRFIDSQQTFRVLPGYHQSGELRPGIKRYNSLPLHGIHRLQRAGAGSELLELRPYAPGDPPKSIAWKVSARRDQLMTRQYESEVPVRVQLLIDGSSSNRMGGHGKRLLDQVNFVAASVARAAVSVGDPVSATLVDGDRLRRLPWFSGDRGFLQLLQELALFSQALPPEAKSVTPTMLRSATLLIQERYPELLDRRYSRLPFSFSKVRSERYLLATAVAQIFGLSPIELMRCYEDDATLGPYIQRLLHEFGMPWMSPLIVDSQPKDADDTSMSKLAQAVASGVAHARDNEVFVLFTNVKSCAAHVDRLVRVCKLAQAKHHRVALVCSTSTFQRPITEQVAPESNRVADLLFAAEQSLIREQANHVKRELTRIGCAVSFSGEQSAIDMVLEEIDRARDGRTHMAGARR